MSLVTLETQVVQALGGILCAAITTGIGVLTPRIKSYIQAHTDAKTATVVVDSLNTLNKITESVVADFTQRMVLDVKTKGGWTPELANQVKANAVSAIKEQGAQLIPLLEKEVGNVEKLIESTIEQAVLKSKTK
ncbi:MULTISPECIES: hypothetical protein [unclassified Bacillus (in: firmicutes)]|uniref:hypothetical protein n=1 Tax=unclassified Bacillus (in: firmicutes) TaxID=185979 RepID=UPI0008F0CF6F|nr:MULTISPECIES: hypothetical protein [unclassified Bacillus (in: firmicutes)]SFI02154.1 hypothetical protein SAMN04488574_101287 [Bacillus sp. 71mf]SFS91852.1 hypothetical protein SAMN04488145_1053 [Bacillus sp. 103mf]